MSDAEKVWWFAIDKDTLRMVEVAEGTPGAFAFQQADPAAQQKAEPVALNNYVQPVPDHCDRITWRGRYFHLPLAAPPLDAEGLRLLLEARSAVEYWTPDESNATESERPKLNEWYRLRDAIDAYLAKYHSGPVVGAPSAQRDNAE